MASRTEYNQCMRPWITGTGKTQAQRRLDFCTGAKVCAKGLSKEDAIEICSQPKEPKVRATRARKGMSCEKGSQELSQCVIDNIDMNLADTPKSLKSAIADAMLKCKCGGNG